MKRELTCIGCPMGCTLRVELEGEKIVSLEGNQCLRGDRYARQEVVAPERMVTSLMLADFRHTPVSVKTAQPIPKGKIKECLEEIRQTHPALPVRRGDVLISNVADTGIPVVATRDVM